MTKEEIEENSKIIAEYMGGEHNNSHPEDNGVKINGEFFMFPYYHYHDSWNWLMPVCRKIIESYHDMRGDIFSGLNHVDIEETFSAVVEFIKFWNDDSQPKMTWNK